MTAFIGRRTFITLLSGAAMLDRLRKITDKPIKWVVNTHFHADHHYGNSVFKAAGATIVAHADTARIMQQVDPKEFARRQPFFKSRTYDPGEVKLTLPDVTLRQGRQHPPRPPRDPPRLFRAGAKSRRLH